jgi:hypothetical protein
MNNKSKFPQLPCKVLPHKITQNSENSRLSPVQSLGNNGSERNIMAAHGNKADVEVLVGWKEIADYLRKGVRTVQRYERDLGLPVRRPLGHSTSSVLATKTELDLWVTDSPLNERFALSRSDASTSNNILSFRRSLAKMARLREEASQVRHSLANTIEVLKRTALGTDQKRNTGRVVSEAQPPGQRSVADAKL